MYIKLVVTMETKTYQQNLEFDRIVPLRGTTPWLQCVMSNRIMG